MSPFISAAEWNQVWAKGLKPKRKSKYKNVKTQIDGMTFDSKLEASRYQELKLLQDAGHITDLKCQVPFELAPGVVIQGRKRPPLRYVCDFLYRQDGGVVIEDCKGMSTDVFRIKRHLMASQLGLHIFEYRKRK